MRWSLYIYNTVRMLMCKDNAEFNIHKNPHLFNAIGHYLNTYIAGYLQDCQLLRGKIKAIGKFSNPNTTAALCKKKPQKPH